MQAFSFDGSNLALLDFIIKEHFAVIKLDAKLLFSRIVGRLVHAITYSVPSLNVKLK